MFNVQKARVWQNILHIEFDMYGKIDACLMKNLSGQCYRMYGITLYQPFAHYHCLCYALCVIKYTCE